MRVKLIRLDIENLNNRIYRREFMEESVRDYNNKISEGIPGYGQIGFENVLGDVSLTRSSHIVSNLEFEGDFLMGDVKILTTIEGSILKGLIDDGSEILFRPNSIGEVNDNNEVIVNRIISFNAVIDPSEDSWNGLMDDEVEVEVELDEVTLSFFRDRFNEDGMMTPIVDYMSYQMTIVEDLIGSIGNNILLGEDGIEIFDMADYHKSIHDNCLKFVIFKSLEREDFNDLMEKFIEHLLEKEEYEMVGYYTNILNEYEGSV